MFYVEHLLTFKKNNQNFFIIIVNNYEYIDLLYFKIKKIFFLFRSFEIIYKKIINTMSIKYEMTNEGVGAQYQRIIGLLGIAKKHGLKFVHRKIIKYVEFGKIPIMVKSKLCNL